MDDRVLPVPLDVHHPIINGHAAPVTQLITSRDHSTSDTARHSNIRGDLSQCEKNGAQTQPTV